MTNKEILQKVILKAEKNGYNSEKGISLIDLVRNGLAKDPNTLRIDSDYFEFNVLVPFIIFSHNFAKAFFGNWEMQAQDKTGIPIPIPYVSATQAGSGKMIWEFHLQQMVLEKHPLKYLERFLKD